MDSPYLNQVQFENIFKNHLKIETYSKSIESLFSLRNRRKIDYKPYYQRNYVWDLGKASYFIESLIIGTEIPPLIFFNNGESIEIIDGRQRFETLKLFLDNGFKLKRKGLSSIKSLKNLNFDILSENIRDSFLSTTLRIIEFEIVNEPKLHPLLQDKVKKEIFGRYNSGITPLRRSEVDNAVYDEDTLTNLFKKKFKTDKVFHKTFTNLFFKDSRFAKSNPDGIPVEMAMQFIRRNLVLHKVPINYYPSPNKNEIIERLYYQLVDTDIEYSFLFDSFCNKVELISGLDKDDSLGDCSPNRFFNECLLWGLYVLENEGLNVKTIDDSLKDRIVNHYVDSNEDYSDVDYAFSAKVLARYSSTLSFLEKAFSVDLNLYKIIDSDTKHKMTELLADVKSDEGYDKLESLRLNKPEPSRNSIEDVSSMMRRRKFMVRPSYQRAEVINLPKASSIIESILLGITLPAIFIYKKDDGVSEVIDGQQRILTILGYIGEDYVNEEGKTVRPKNHNFKLRNPKILKEYAGFRFNDLPELAQNKILEFQLFLVSIEEKLNPDFEPIDLFIRLNDKPYPIKEHSFEMWNSWVDKDIITSIKYDTAKNLKWFYVRSSNRKNFKDRMENEEIITSLTYLNYKRSLNSNEKYLAIYQKESRLNSRLGNKYDLTNILNLASTREDVKSSFLNMLKETRSFIRKVRLLLISEDVENDVDDYLRCELDKVFNPNNRKGYKRTFQDFYILWFVVSPINLEMIKDRRVELRIEVEDIFNYIKDIPEEHSGGYGYDHFLENVNRIHTDYVPEKRKINLSVDEVKLLIEKQNNMCPISITPMFFGDDIEVDHVVPLAIGGKDSIENLQVVHKDSNRKKGSKREIK